MAAGTSEVIGSGFVAKQREIRKQDATTIISWKGRRESGEATGLNNADFKDFRAVSKLDEGDRKTTGQAKVGCSAVPIPN